MYKTFILNIIIIFLIGEGYSQDIPHGKLISHNFTSELLINRIDESKTRNILVYTPPSYQESSGNGYPVLYLLHSYGETPDSWLKSPYTQGMNIQRSMDSLISLGKIKEMIVVMPDCSNRYGGSWYTNSRTTGLWINFITEELVQFIDENYLTISKAESRGIAGHSMGGYGALKIAMLHPDVFGHVYAMSSINMASDKIANMKYGDLLSKLNDHAEIDSFTLFDKLIFSKAIAFVPNDTPPYYCDFLYTIEDGKLTRETNVWDKWSEHLLINQIDEFKRKNFPLTIAFDHGSQDFLVNESRSFSNQLNEQGIDHTYNEYDGDHTNQFRKRFENYALPYLSKHMR